MSGKGYVINADFFKEWTRNSAWFYGWLLTDGYISEKTGQIRVMLKSIDRDVLEKIKAITEFSGPIFDGEHVDGRKYSYFRVCRKEMTEDLFILGMARVNKTFNTRFPDIPKSLVWDFIRGVFEGDGNLKHGSRWNDLTITIASATKSFLLDLQSALLDYGINSIVKEDAPGKSGRKNPLYRLITKSNADALRWCFLMYRNTDMSTRLDRKFEIFRNYVSGYYDRNRRSIACIETVEEIKRTIPECYEWSA